MTSVTVGDLGLGHRRGSWLADDAAEPKGCDGFDLGGLGELLTVSHAHGGCRIRWWSKRGVQREGRRLPKVSPEYREARRREIIGAARAAFAERGFANTSMSDLVAAAGLSMGALYSYFPSKADIVLAVVKEGDGVADNAVVDKELPSEMLSRFLAAVTPKTPETTTQARFSAQVLGEAVSNVKLASGALDTVHAVHAQLVRRLIATGEHRGQRTSAADERECDDDAFANILLAVLVGFTSLVAIDYPVDVDAFERTLLHIVTGN